MPDVESVTISQAADGFGLSPEILLVAVLPKFLLFVAALTELSDVHPNIEIFRGHPTAFLGLRLLVERVIVAGHVVVLRPAMRGGFLPWFGCLTRL